MHVHAAKQIALAEHLQVLHHAVVTDFLRGLAARPAGRRMGARGEIGKAVIRRHHADRLAQVFQFVVDFFHRIGGLGRDLELRLQHLAVHHRADLALQVGKKRGRGLLAQGLGVAVDDEILLLHPEAVILFGHGNLPARANDGKKRISCGGWSPDLLRPYGPK